MRYGSIPDGYDQSMTHLEYDEAQRLELPSLIYIIDEEISPSCRRMSRPDQGQRELRDSKEQLKKRHVVSCFTTPDDLRARILHDVPELLKEMGAEISGDVELPEAPSDAEVLREFRSFPSCLLGSRLRLSS